MSQRLIDAAERNYGEPGVPPAVPHTMLVREAVAHLGHGTMTYRCEACGFEWEVWLGLGVEGPPELREVKLYVPCAFTAGRCPSWPVKPDATVEERATYRHLTQCDGTMAHVRFGDDRNFPPTLIPDDAPRFLLSPVYDQADLVIPEAAVVRARRYHADAAKSRKEPSGG